MLNQFKETANTETILNIPFFSGSISEVLKLTKKGGLLTAPSGPGLANDLPNSFEYRRSLERSDIVLADSGLLCLWSRFFSKKTLRRLSGLEFLSKFLQCIDFLNDSTFWVMPDYLQSQKNCAWLKKEFGADIDQGYIYIAPKYSSNSCIKDHALLTKIEQKQPKYIFIQLGGGVQERLGIFLKENLSYKTSIICTGAALAFLSGCQVRIPNWVDFIYMGWLYRCISNPKVFLPRYFKAFRLLILLFKCREKSPMI